MRRLIRTELLKLRTIRFPYGLLAGATALTAIITAVLASRAGHVTQAGGHIGLGGTLPPLDTKAGLEVVITASRFGLLFATILGVIVTAGEFRHGTATPTYLATPHRTRVMFAKVVAASGAGVLFGLAASLTATAVGVAFAAGKGFDISVSGATMLRYAMGAALGAALFAAIGAAVGSLIRNQAAGIVGVLAWGLVFENVLAGAFPSFERWLPYAASIGMAGRPESGTALPFGVAALLLAAIAAAIAAVASRTTVQRDIA